METFGWLPSVGLQEDWGCLFVLGEEIPGKRTQGSELSEI